jgi:ferredoxin
MFDMNKDHKAIVVNSRIPDEFLAFQQVRNECPENAISIEYSG